VASEAGVWSADVCASDLPYICSPESATELGRPLLSFALSGLGSIVGAFPVVPHYAALRASPLATICRAAGAGLVDSAKASEAYRTVCMAHIAALIASIVLSSFGLNKPKGRTSA